MDQKESIGEDCQAQLRIQTRMQKADAGSWLSGFPETPCGAGSMFENTEVIRGWLAKVLDTYNLFSIADIGCGDQNWIHRCLPNGIEYSGFDIQPRRQDVHEFDVSREILKFPVDLVLCIYVLNHMRPDLAERALRLIKESGSKFLLMSYSDHDQYSLAGAGELVLSVEHKIARRHSWRYGFWRL